MRVLEADIAAAFVAADATAWRANLLDAFILGDSDYDGFLQRCERDLVDAFPDVVSRARFEPPKEYDWNVPEELVKFNEDSLAFKAPARCTVDLRAGLGG